MPASGHTDLSVIWAPVMPETSKFAPAMEQLAKDSKTKFQAQTKDITKPLDESLAKSATKAKDAFTGIGKSAKDSLAKAGAEGGKALSDSVAEQTESKVPSTFSRIGSKITAALGVSGDDGAKSLVDKFTAGTGKLSTVADALGKDMGDKISGGIGDALKRIPGVDGATDDLQKISDHAKDVGDKFKDVKENVEQLTGILGGGLATSAPKAAEALEKMVGPLTEIGAALALVEPLEDFLKDLPGIGNTLKDNLPDSGGFNWLKSPFKHIWQGIRHPSSFGQPGMGLDKNGNPISGDQSSDDDDIGYDSMLLGKSDAAYNDMLLGGNVDAPNHDVLSSTNDAYDIFSSGKDLPFSMSHPKRKPHEVSKWGRADSGSDSASTEHFDWNAVAEHESGGDWSKNTGNGYYGGLQFDMATWKQFGGTDFADRPDHATREQQIIVANRVPKGQRASRWPNTYQFGVVDDDDDDDSKKGGKGRGSSDAGRSSGGDGGAAAGHPTGPPPDEYTIRDWAERNFGIPNTFGTGSWENAAHDDDGKWHHPKPGMSDYGPDLPSGDRKYGYAFDFHGTPEQMSKMANYIADNYKDQTLELIYGGAGFDHNREINNGRFGDVYGAGLNAEHTDHVHWATTKMPGRGGAKGPKGTKDDPLYTSKADKDSDSKSESDSLSEGFGANFLSGMLQEVGLDGSVFKGFGNLGSPLDFGITKLATGLVNHFGAMAHQGSAGDQGAHISAATVPVGPGGAQNVRSNETHSTSTVYGDHIEGDVTNNISFPHPQRQYPAPSLRATSQFSGGSMPTPP